MPVVSFFSNIDKNLTIVITGAFSFTDQKDFMKAYADKEIGRCILDMGLTLDIDRSALGLLLLLKDTIATDTDISITHCNSKVRKILIMARFDKSFHIE